MRNSLELSPPRLYDFPTQRQNKRKYHWSHLNRDYKSYLPNWQNVPSLAPYKRREKVKPRPEPVPRFMEPSNKIEV